MSICATGISKSFGATRALREVTLEVANGELFGLIGPDGAGKTTFFRILTTLLLPDSGRAQVDGMDVVADYRQIRRNVGYMPGRFSLYQDLTVRENLNFFATIFGTTPRENYELIRDIYEPLEPFRNRRAGALSGGMKQKLALACALIHKPRVLFLDEPTTGVDPLSRKELWEMLRRLQERKITILVSTAYMDEAERCDRIGLIQDGGLLKVDRPENLKKSYPAKLYNVGGRDTYRLLKDTGSYPGTGHVYAFGEYLHVTGREGKFRAEDLLRFLREKGHPDATVAETEPTIEDAFMQLSGTHSPEMESHKS